MAQIKNKKVVWILLIILIVLIGAIYIFANQSLKVSQEASTNGTSTTKVLGSCTVGNCPSEIFATSSGQTFTYSGTSRFTVILDKNLYPPAELICRPDGVIGTASNIPSVTPPFYAARFEAVKAGSCILSDRDFHVTIVVQ
jgi:hypothetical protein